MKRRVLDLVHESKALQFEVGSRQQTVTVPENPCLSHRNQHPNAKISSIALDISYLQVMVKTFLIIFSANSYSPTSELPCHTKVGYSIKLIGNC